MYSDTIDDIAPHHCMLVFCQLDLKCSFWLTVFSFDSSSLTPDVCGVSESLERICAPLNIRNVFVTANTLKQVLMRVKSQVPEEKKKGVVYQVPCKDCDGVYTGESNKLRLWVGQLTNEAQGMAKLIAISTDTVIVFKAKWNHIQSTKSTLCTDWWWTTRHWSWSQLYRSRDEWWR